MPSQDRLQRLVRELVEAALDQPNPSPELRRCLKAYMEAAEHRCRCARVMNSA